MIASFLDSTTLPLLQKVAAFGQRRHEVLAGNVANIDTPDYKMRDLPVAEFQAALHNAIRRSTQPSSLSEIQSLGDSAGPELSSRDESLDDLFPRELFQAAPSEPHEITFQDGGNRSIEHQMMELTKNAMRHGFVVEVMSAQMNLLQAAISERP
jgi:flagellar basal-body rod protein FlgB